MAIKYAVDKKVPVPAFRGRATTRYPFAEMDVNDSFFVPMIDVASSKSLRQSTYAASKKHGGKSFRMVEVENGYRVFRIK